MATETNPFYYATNEQGGGASPPVQIQDSVDFPHTGLIKALQQGMQGNYAIKGSANEFDITQASTGNVVSVSGGTVFENGALVTVSGTTDFTSSSFNATDGNYHLLVCNGGTLAIRKFSTSTIDRVPEFNAGDVIIAVIKYTSDGFGSMEVQYLTTSKAENELSIGRDDSGYTEGLTVKSNAGDVEIEAKEEDKDIIFKVNDGGTTTEVLRIDGSTGNVGIRLNQNVTADERLDVEDGNISLTTTDRTTERVLKLRNSGSTTSMTEIAMAGANSNNFEGYIAFKTKGPSDLYNDPLNEVMRIDGNKKVGIGETAPSADLHIKSSANFDPTSAINTATLILEQTGGTQADNNESVGMTFTKINSGRPFGSIAGVQTGSDADVGGLAFFTHDALTSTDTISEKMRIDGNGNVGIGTTSPDAPLHVETSGTGDAVIIESTDTGGGGLAPDLVLKRNTSVASEELGNIRFLGLDSGAAEQEYADLYAGINDNTAGSESGEIFLRTIHSGDIRRRIDITKNEVVINEDSIDSNFRVESNGNENMLFVDAGLNAIGIANASPSATLDVSGNIEASTTINSGTSMLAGTSMTATTTVTGTTGLSTTGFYQNTNPTTILSGISATPTPISCVEQIYFIHEDPLAGSFVAVADPNAVAGNIVTLVNLQSTAITVSAQGGLGFVTGNAPAIPTYTLGIGNRVRMIAVTDGNLNIPAGGAQAAIVGPAWVIIGD